MFNPPNFRGLRDLEREFDFIGERDLVRAFERDLECLFARDIFNEARPLDFDGDADLAPLAEEWDLTRCLPREFDRINFRDERDLERDLARHLRPELDCKDLPVDRDLDGVAPLFECLRPPKCK